MIGIKKERVEQNAHQALVSAMRFHRGANILLQSLVGLLEGVVHIDRYDALVVSGQIVRDVLERKEGCCAHQKLAEEQRRSSWFPQNADCLLGRPGAGIVRLFDLLDRFENAILLLEVSPALPSVREALAHHRARLHAVEDVEKVVRVAAHQGSRERDQSLRRAAENAKTIALRCIAGQLMQLVGDREIEPSAHIASDELDGSHALEARPIGLPQWGEAVGAAAGRGQSLRDFELVSKVERRELLHFGVEYGDTRIRIDDPSEIRTRLGFEIDVLPEVTQLASVLARDEERWARKPLPPFPTTHTPHFRQCEALALIHRSAFAQLHFADAMRPARIAAVPHVLDEKGPCE